MAVQWRVGGIAATPRRAKRSRRVARRGG